jgi:hypothetical protein
MYPQYKVAYLCLGTTHKEYAGVTRALAQQGIEADLIDLAQVDQVDWSCYSLVNVRMCRNFHLDPLFLSKIEALNRHLQSLQPHAVPLINPINLIRHALDKRIYLQDLAQSGVMVIPTYWVERNSTRKLADIMEEKQWDDVVVKPAISSRSWHTFRVTRAANATMTTESTYLLRECSTKGSELPEYEKAFAQVIALQDVSIQPFLPAILTSGELSFVFLNGKLSHTIRKTVQRDGGWFAHELLGGTNQLITPELQERRWAEDVYGRLVNLYGPLVFGRIDGIADQQGNLQLSECELVIPRLFLQEGDAFDRYASAITAFLQREQDLLRA